MGLDARLSERPMPVRASTGPTPVSESLTMSLSLLEPLMTR